MALDTSSDIILADKESIAGILIKSKDHVCKVSLKKK